MILELLLDVIEELAVIPWVLLEEQMVAITQSKSPNNKKMLKKRHIWGSNGQVQPKTEQNVPIVLSKMSWQKKRFSVCSPSSEIMRRLSSLSSRNSFSGKATGIKRPLSRLQASTCYHVICIQAGPGTKNKRLRWTEELCNNSCWEWENVCGWKWKIKPRR